MLEKPDLPDSHIAECLRDEHGLRLRDVSFLPLGADQHAAAYRAVAEDGRPYFVKLRDGAFHEASVALPRYLSDQGIEPVIPPLLTRSGNLWAAVGRFRLILFPYVEGRTADERVMTPRHWVQLGSALRRIHALELPARLRDAIGQETYAERWRQAARVCLEVARGGYVDDRVAEAAASLLLDRRGEIFDLVDRAGRLAQELKRRRPAVVLCHSDVHASNVLIADDGALSILDWDDPILAPKERDLMFFGGGQRFAGHSPQDEEDRFYQGYGQTEIDAVALAYYRYERIVVDIAIFAEQLLLTREGGRDREQSLRYLASNFEAGGTIAVARDADRTREGAET